MGRHVQPGQRIQIPAEFYNKTVDLITAAPPSTSGRSVSLSDDATLCRVVNTMDFELPLFGVIGLGDPTALIDDTDCIEPFIFNGVAADGYNWGLTLQKIASGDVGWVRVSGLCHCWIDISPDHPIQFAGPDAGGGIAHLVQAECGARVIWRAAGSGPQRGIICL